MKTGLRMGRLVFCGFVTSGVAAGGRAEAAEAPVARTPTLSTNANAVPSSDWHALGYVGGYSAFDSAQSGGLTFGASFRFRMGPFVAGPLLEFGFGGELYSFAGAAVAGGFSVRVESGLRLELLGTFGGHQYSGVGADFILGNDPGASGGMAYAGARAILGYLWGQEIGHFELGAYADFQDDLRRPRIIYTYDPGTGWFGGSGHGDQVLGMARLGFGLEFGGTHDIF